jgi:hypothetical protein
MRNLIFIGLVTMISLFGCSSNSIEEIKALGTNEFSKEAWNSATQEERGKMVFSLLNNHDVKKIRVEEIKLLLGESTAYYEYDEFPAYLIGPTSIKSDHHD